MKYHTSGEKLWEQDIPETTELDSIFTRFFDVSERMSGKERIALNTYVAGISSEEGQLYLILQVEASNDLWIHEFTNNGQLSRRFQLVSKDVNLASIFDIDSANRRIFVVTEEAEVRAYQF